MRAAIPVGLILVLAACSGSDHTEYPQPDPGGDPPAPAPAPAPTPAPTPVDRTPSIAQGVYGKVQWLSGNHMPGPEPAGGSASFVAREVRVYELTRTTQVTPKDTASTYGHYGDFETALVASRTSGADGFFEIELDPGDYSVFVGDAGSWYCNSMSNDGLCVVHVVKGRATKFDVRIDYEAAY